LKKLGEITLHSLRIISPSKKLQQQLKEATTERWFIRWESKAVMKNYAFTEKSIESNVSFPIYLSLPLNNITVLIDSGALQTLLQDFDSVSAL
jgi:hypothetical protein